MYKNFRKPVQITMDNIEELIQTDKNSRVDVIRLMRSFSLDIISNVVFSMENNSWKNDDFAKRVSKLFTIRKWVIMFFFFMPRSLVRFLKLSFLNQEAIAYFSKMTLNIIEERKKNKDIVYNDFIELLLKSEAEGEVDKNFKEDGHIVRKLSTEEIVGKFDSNDEIGLKSDY